MKPLLLISVLISSFACKSIIPLRSNNEAKPYKIQCKYSFEKTWSKLIDMCYEQGFTVTNANRIDGLLTIHQPVTKLTYELKNEAADKSAYIIAEKIWVVNSKNYYFPSTGNSDWSVAVRRGSDSTIMIYVALIPPVNVTRTMYNGNVEKPRAYKSNGVSTGLFERKIESILNY